MSAPSIYEPNEPDPLREEADAAWHQWQQQQLEEERQYHIFGLLKKVSQGMGTLDVADALAAELGLAREWRQYASRKD